MNAALPINPTIIRIMRVLRIARGRRCPAVGGPVRWAVGGAPAVEGGSRAVGGPVQWSVPPRWAVPRGGRSPCGRRWFHAVGGPPAAGGPVRPTSSQGSTSPTICWWLWNSRPSRPFRQARP
jgi:hypothetical protein